MFDPYFFSQFFGQRSINYKSAYYHAVLARVMWYIDFDGGAQNHSALMTTWGTVAGATSQQFFPSTTEIMPGFIVYRSGNQAIVHITGTSNGPQGVCNVALAGTQRMPLSAMRAHRYFLLCALNVIGNLNAFVGADNPSVLFVGHSLGGAVAEVAAKLWFDAGKSVAGVITMGQPRAFNFSLAGGPVYPAYPFARYCVAGDPIPGACPTILGASTLGGIGLMAGLFGGIAYQHFVLANVLERTRGDDYSSRLAEYPGPTFAPLLAGRIVYNSVTQGVLSEFHLTGTYAEYFLRLSRLVIRPRESNPVPFIGTTDPIFVINETWMAPDVAPAVAALTWPATPATPRPFLDPLAVIVIASFAMTISSPTADLAEPVENRAVSFNLYRFSGATFMANRFRGRDRRLLTTLQKAITAIQVRDSIATKGGQSRLISTPTVMFPPGGSPDESVTLATIQTQVNALLALSSTS
jgi:hypothetical protein